jgi:hypothetical protein
VDADGQYDALNLIIPVEVAVEDWYALNARLVDVNQEEITWSGGYVYLTPGTHDVIFPFPGEPIGQHGVDGPYQVRDFSMYSYSHGHSLNRVLLHTTQPYSFAQFEGAVTTPTLVILPPLSGTSTVALPAGQEIPIRFKWIVGGHPTLDQSVAIRIRDQNNRLVAGYTYGYGISYDPATGEYQQPFRPTRYGLDGDDTVRILVYIGGQLKGTAVVDLN